MTIEEWSLRSPRGEKKQVPFFTQHFCGQKSHEDPSRFYIRVFFLLNLLIQSYRILSGWWLSHPSEKY